MSSTYTLLLEPIDVLSLRDYRGLEPGEQHDVGTLFPTPTVMMGAVRGALFRAAGADFNRTDPREGYGVPDQYRGWLGGPDPEEPFSLTLRGPWLVRGLDGDAPSLWLPKPLGGRSTFDPSAHGDLRPRFHGATRASSLRLAPPGHKDGGGPSYVRAHKPNDALPEEEFFARERRVGITRKLATRSVEAGLFYLQDTLRFARGVGLAVEVEAKSGKHIELLKSLGGQAIPLGGRGHHVRVTVCADSLRDTSARSSNRVWCLTPLPLHQSQGLILPPGVSVEALEALEAGEPLIVGGFDRAHRRPHPLVRALPAGAVITLSQPLNSPPDHGWGMSDTHKRAGYGVTQLLGDTPS